MPSSTEDSENIRDQTFLLVRSQKQTCFPDSKQKNKTEGKQLIIPISERLVNRQGKLYGHLVRASVEDLMKNVTMYKMEPEEHRSLKEYGDQKQNGTRLQGNRQIKQLVDKNAILPNWDIHMKDPELDHIFIQSAADRDFCKTLT